MSKGICSNEHMSQRLATERMRLGLTQGEMAKAAGTPFRTYCTYEAGYTEPRGSFFTAIAGAGADVLYILTGARDRPQQDSLTVEEVEMINRYRGFGAQDQAVARRVMECIADAGPGG